MLNMGDSPVDFTRMQFDTGEDVAFSSYNGKTVLVSFLEVTNGWNWLKNMLSVQIAISASGLSSSVQIVAVVYKYMGCTSSGKIIEKINSDPDLPAPGDWPFPVFVDTSWASSAAFQYLNGFANTVDPLFHGQCGNLFWSYLISNDYKITDKWHPNITSVGDPISFNKLTSIGTFDSSNLAATENFIAARIANLCAAPKILYANPVSGSLHSSVSTVKLICSKLLGNGAAVSGNYSLGGTVTGLSISGVSYTGADRVEDVVTLSIGGTPGVSGSLSISAGSSVADTAGNAFQSGCSSVSYQITV